MTVRAGHEDALALLDDALEDYRAILNAGVTNGTLLGRDEFPAFAALASLAAVVDEHNGLVGACLEEHHIATAGPREGMMIHSECVICEWLSTHPDGVGLSASVPEEHEVTYEDLRGRVTRGAMRGSTSDPEDTSVPTVPQSGATQ